MKNRFNLGLLLITVILCSCGKYKDFGTDNVFYEGNYVQKRASEILDLSDSNQEKLPSEYNFVVIADLHIGVRGRKVPDMPNEYFLKWLSDLPAEEKPAFILCVGDVADTGSRVQFDEYELFLKQIEELGIKVFNAVGNHDLYQSGWSNWEETCYPHTSYYRFKTAGYSYYALDTGTGYLGPKQMENLKEEMEDDPLPKIIFTHYPLYTDDYFFNFDDTTERNLLMSYFADNNVKFHLAGHLHWLEKHDFGAYQSFALPSFRYKGQWTVFYVNEKAETYDFKVISK